MRAIRNKNTRPEIIVRKALYAAGFRYRLHASKLPGKPDIVFKKYRALVFVHGCFWHLHDCSAFKMPTERRDFWETKLSKNAARDAITESTLFSQGWRIAKVWECALRGRKKRNTEEIVAKLGSWLIGDQPSLEIRESD